MFEKIFFHIFGFLTVFRFVLSLNCNLDLIGHFISLTNQLFLLLRRMQIYLYLFPSLLHLAKALVKLHPIFVLSKLSDSRTEFHHRPHPHLLLMG
jgi:hypothetical protein